MNQFKFRLFIWFLLPCFLSTLASIPSAAGDTPPDNEAAILKSNLTANPDDAASWIRLGDLQRIMGYSHDSRESFAKAAEAIKKLPKKEKREIAGAYFIARAWLEYDATDWNAAVDFGNNAVKYGASHESRLIKGLAMAAVPFPEDDVRAALKFVKPISNPGPENRSRNYYWIRLVFHHHHHREAMNLLEWSHVGMWVPEYNWAELFCRRDYGYVYESHGEWKEAATYFRFSVERSPVGEGTWAIRHERQTPSQTKNDPPMPFWTNLDGGYVTGSLMAYSDFACEQMLQVSAPEERSKWAIHAGDGASRSLAVYINQPSPWLWRALAWQVQGELNRAEEDLAQAKAEFAAIGKEAILFPYAMGHQLILMKQYGKALPWLEKSTQDTPHLARCWSDLGLARVMSHDRDGALAAYNKALELSPDMAVALHNRGMLHLQESRPDEAHADLTRAAEIAPQDQQIVADLQRAKQAMK